MNKYKPKHPDMNKAMKIPNRLKKVTSDDTIAGPPHSPLHKKPGIMKPSENLNITLNILDIPPSIKKNLIEHNIKTINDLLYTNEHILHGVNGISYGSIDKIVYGLQRYNQGIISDDYIDEMQPTSLGDSVLFLNIDGRIMQGLNNLYQTTQSHIMRRKQLDFEFYRDHILYNDGSIPTPLDITINDLLDLSRNELNNMRYVGKTLINELITKMELWCKDNGYNTNQFKLFNYKSHNVWVLYIQPNHAGGKSNIVFQNKPSIQSLAKLIYQKEQFEENELKNMNKLIEQSWISIDRISYDLSQAEYIENKDDYL